MILNVKDHLNLSDTIDVRRFKVTEYNKIQITGLFINLPDYVLRPRVTTEQIIPWTLIFDSRDTFHFVTNVDHKAKLTVNINYKYGPYKKKRLLQKYEYQVRENNNGNEKFSWELEIEFKNLDFRVYLLKESEILNYFNDFGNDVLVSHIVQNQKNLKVILVNPGEFSLPTKRLTYAEICKDTLKIADLIVVPCSIKIRNLDKVNNNYANNIINIDFETTNLIQI